MITNILKDILIKFLTILTLFLELAINFIIIFSILSFVKVIYLSIPLCVAYAAIYLYKLNPFWADKRIKFIKWLHKIMDLHYTE